MKRFEPMEQRRFEPQVAPKLDTPTGLYPSAAAAHVPAAPIPTVDLSGINDALRNLGALSAQLGDLKREADRETDELAMIDYDGLRRTTAAQITQEFDQLPITEQNGEAVAGHAQRYTDLVAEGLKKIPMSDRYREVMAHLAYSHSKQFEMELNGRALHNQVKYDADRMVANVRSPMDAGDVATTAARYDFAVSRGVRLGMSREQAISRAALNNLANGLSALDAPTLDDQLRQIDAELATDKKEFRVGEEKDGFKMTRADLLKLRELALREQHRRFDAGYEEAQKLRETGDFTPEKIRELYDTKQIGTKLYRKLLGELATETKTRQRDTYIELCDYIADRIDAADDDTARGLGELRGGLDQLVSSGEIDSKQALALKTRIDAGLKKMDATTDREERREARMKALEDRAEASRVKAARSDLIDRILLHITEQAFYKAKGGEFDRARLAMEQEIKESPNLNAKERGKLLDKIRQVGDGEKLFNTAEGKRVAAWFDDHIAADGNVTGLSYDGPLPDIKDQGLQKKAYNELRELAQQMLYLGTDPDAIIEKLNAHKKQLVDKGVNDAIAKAIAEVHGTDKDYSRIPSLFGSQAQGDRSAKSYLTLAEMLTDLGKAEFGGSGDDKQEDKKEDKK